MYKASYVSVRGFPNVRARVLSSAQGDFQAC